MYAGINVFCKLVILDFEYVIRSLARKPKHVTRINLTMSLKPTVALHGSLPVLQPEFYCSDIFVIPIRSDLDKLLADFARCLLNGSDQHGLRGLSSNIADQTAIPPVCDSFAMFKTCWMSSDWRFMHLRCLDAIGRVAFLHVLHRMFLGEYTCVIGGRHPNLRRQRAQSYWSNNFRSIYILL